MINKCILLGLLGLLITGAADPHMRKITELSQKESATFLAYDRYENKTYYIRGEQIDLVDPKSDLKLNHAATPALSPDENQIAYIKRLNAATFDQAITIYNLRDKTFQDLVTVTKDIYDLYWSPTGKEIAFIAKNDSKDNYASRLYTVDVNSRQISELDPGEHCASMSWSPDGKEFVVSSEGSLNIVNRETKSRKNIGTGTVLSWSPKGEFIAYSGRYFEKTEKNNWYVIKRDGTNKQILFSHKEFIPSGQGFIDKLIWSPDMRYVIYHRTAGEQMYDKKTYLLDLKTKKRTEIHGESGLGIVDWRFAGR
jgi:Tol biopolymer transport system component